jgi:RNA polymerase sigma-70 factor (ECF subfamily)
MDESELAAAATRGDRHAMALLIERQQRALYASAVTLLGSSWDAHDAVQAALTEACASIGTLRDPSKVRPWLAQILVNKCRDTLRDRKRVSPVADAEHLAEMEVFLGSEDDRDLREAIRTLSEERRLVVVLRFFLDLNYEEMAAVTGCPVGTVKSRVYRAIRELRGQVRAAGGSAHG